MKKSKIVLIFAALAAVTILSSSALFTQCSKDASAEEVSAEKSDEIAASMDKNLTNANTKFGFNIFKKLVSEDKDKNVFISPLSILMALAMTYNGAVGETSLAMAEALEFEGFGQIGRAHV